MSIDSLRCAVTRRPIRVVCILVGLAVFVVLAAPDLTRLAAEGQARLLDPLSESAKGVEVVKQAWPDQSYESLAVVALVREGGLKPDDLAYAARLADRFAANGHPSDILRVLGPKSDPRIAERLVSRDRTTQIVVVPLNTSFVAPAAAETVAWLQANSTSDGLAPPPGLELKWSGDAVIGREYMRNVQVSLDRAALVTVVLLLVVLLIVYRSFLLALVPLATIGVSLLIARGLLAWLTQVGWEISPLVELFLVAVLFGSGTDFCLFVSWRFAENWNAANPAGAMRVTLRRAMGALVTSAGTVIIGLLLMGTTRFKLFSSTGPSVALGLALTVAATLTLTPALLVLLARYRPKSFNGMTRGSSGIWDTLGQRAMARPALSWGLVMVILVPIAILGSRTEFLQDTLSELPAGTASVDNLRFINGKLGPGMTSPLTVILESDADLKESQGLALIDDVSRLLGRQRKLEEVRSATQPLGSSAPLDPARLASRLGEVNDGFRRLSTGASLLQQGLKEGLAKLQAAQWVEQVTGIPLTKPGGPAATRDPEAARSAFASGLRQATETIFGQARPGSTLARLESMREASAATVAVERGPKPGDPTAPMVSALSKAADGAGQIAVGADRATKEVSSILDDPVGRRALDRLLVNAETVRDHPELLESFAAYITPDGRQTRIDVAQSARIFSSEALDQVETIRRRLKDHLEEEDGMKVRAIVTGANAGAADTRALTRSDQVQTWFVVPLGVFIVLFLALRDPLACLNLVLTMILTYLVALGLTHFAFVTILGGEGLDWKVPYFLFVLLVAVGVDYNVFLMARLREETSTLGLRAGISRAIAQTGGLITSAAAITAVSFASFLFSPLSSLRQLGFALVVGIFIDAVLVRPLLVPCGHWLINRRHESRRLTALLSPAVQPLTRVSD
jgi:RND superfamily putative drug exporter